MHSYSLLQPRIRELTAVTTADVIASFPPAELATHVRSAERLIPALIHHDILPSYVENLDRSRQDETTYALPLNRGGNAAYWLLDELRSLFKGSLGVDTDVLAQCASLALERRALLTDKTHKFWASQQSGPTRVRVKATDALDRHPALGNLLIALLSQWNTVLVETASHHSMSLVRLFRTITVSHDPALASMFREPSTQRRRQRAEELPHRGLSAWTNSPSWARDWRRDSSRVMLTADVDVAALMCSPGAGEGEFLVSPYVLDNDRIRPSLRIRAVELL